MGDITSEATAGLPLRWTAHRKSAFALRWLVRLAPVTAATILVFVLLQVLPDASSLSGRLARNSVAVLAGFVVSFLVARFATRLLPLAALLKLSLVFPDEAPSRFKMAMKASSSRQLERDLEAAKVDGLVDANQSAAEQVLAMATAIGTHDRRTRGHSERVRVYSRMIGEEMGLAGDDLEKLQWGALLHDMGKIHVSPAILNKPGRPDEQEWAELQTHPEEGRHLLAPLDYFLGEWASASWGHHEKWDGSGYPAGLAGEEIPLAARIVAVADAYEVMTATRAYKTPMSAEEARRELALSAGTHFDPEVVRATLALSVGRLQLAAGPMSFILGLPFAAPLASLARTFARFPDVGAAAGAAGAAVASIAVAGAAVAGGLAGVGEREAEVALAAVDESGDNTAAPVSGDDAQSTPDVDVEPGDATASTSPTTAQRSAVESTSEPSTPLADGTSTSTSTPTPTSTPASTSMMTLSPALGAERTQTSSTLGTTSTTVARSTSTSLLGSTTSRPQTPSSIATPPTSTQITVTTSTTAPPQSGPTASTGDVDFMGPLTAATDLSKRGPYFETGSLNLWEEQTIILADDLTVDGVIIPAGTAVTSYYFSYSPSEDSLTAATVDLGARVLAVAGSSGDLRSTDDFGPDGAVYEASRKLGRADAVTASGTAVEVRLETSGGAMDQFRVLVAG